MLRNGGVVLREVIPLVGLLFFTFGGCTPWRRFAYEGFWRERWQKPDEVLAALKLRPGEQVADLGAGGGYFTFRLAQAVTPAGRVYAVDVDDGLLKYIGGRARDEHLDNIGIVHARLDDAMLPVGSIDLLFTCDTYHHLENRTEYFRNVRKYLKPAARLAVIDLKSHGILAGWLGHSTAPETIRQELEAAGYRYERSFDFLPKQHFLIFAAP
ncbi:MAG: methyltransferase domain-containing protein [Deltaproteobacteria bacterium]|nr:methyltransferase domain-containing protein [Deltaproteobacteria bacterium]